MNKTAVVVIVLLVIGLVAAVIAFRPPTPTPTASGTSPTPSSPVQSTPAPAMQPETVIKPDKTYSAVLTTSVGEIAIDLDIKNTPVTANNFVYLAQKHFYDGTVFHRVLKGFMIQGGDPQGDGTGGPGYQFADEPITGEYTRGTVAMANSGPDTNGSQFFIMHADYDLPKNYVIFGRVTTGLDTVDKIAAAPVQPNAANEPSSPVTPVSVSSVTIREK